MTIQHVIRNQSESSADAIGKMYGTTASSILKETFGATGASVIYPWLEQNGGLRQGKDNNVPTGYHWSWNSGMVVNVPGSGPSQSPAEGFGFMIPGGPMVEINGISGKALPPPETSPAYTEKVKEAETKGQTPPPVEDFEPTEMKKAGFGWFGILLGGAAAFATYKMMYPKAVKTTKKKGRR